MSFKHMMNKGVSFLKQRFGYIFLNLISIYLFIETMPEAATIPFLLWSILFVGFMAMFWVPKKRRWTPMKRNIYILVLWGLAIFSWTAFEMRETTVSMVYILIGVIALTLPRNASYVTAAVVILTYLIIDLTTEPGSLESILLVASNYIGIFVMMWAFRIKNEATALSKLHYQQLSIVHAELEQAHVELQEAHLKLEEATVDSLRFAVLEERSRIARDIHDSIGHGLTSVIVQLQALPYVIKANSDEADATVRSVLEVARNCLKDVRKVVHEMAEDGTDSGIIALKSLVKQVQEQSGLPIKFTSSSTLTLWEHYLSEALYRILQEALTNVIRHAEASRVLVSIQEVDTDIVMTISDDGKFNAQDIVRPGFGMNGMKTRCERLQGTFEFHPIYPHGMMLTIRLPLRSNVTERENMSG
ncbi:sensor histidine kinase [Paenibacillus sp. Marseille-Q4541]|uniref:sensor histidine kinase n=1 Tax=Paenibacillus sp. Marseille-Q4541 TaxID=2831522 RepID=UPI001BAD9404